MRGNRRCDSEVCGKKEYSNIMVKHIILWTLKEELSDAEKAAIKAGIKEGLEGLVGKVPGLLDVKVHIDGRLASSKKARSVESTVRITTS